MSGPVPKLLSGPNRDIICHKNGAAIVRYGRRPLLVEDGSMEGDLAAVADYLAGRDDVVAAYLFGSAAEGVAHRWSDLDIALLLPQTMEPRQRLEVRLEVIAALENRTRRPVDVVILNDAPLMLRFQVLKHGKVLVDRDPTRRCLFAARTMGMYYDTRRYLEYHLDRLIRRIRKEGLGAGYHGHQDTLEKARRLSARLAALSKDSA